MGKWIDGAPKWALGIYDYGLLYNETTGWHAPLQCHITVCSESSRDGANVHISMYETAGAQISVYIRDYAWAKLYFKPNASGDLQETGGPFNRYIKRMPCYDLVKAQAETCFYEKYPQMRRQAVPNFTDQSAWPSL